MSSLAEAQGSLHVSVLLSEVTEAVKAKDGGMFLDCTFGGGGHTRAILDASEDSWVVALDRDNRALERAKSWAGSYGDRLRLIHAPFSEIAEVVGSIKFDAILADLGVSTDQLREGRGFSFADSDALDMRMDESNGVTAAEFINSASERELFLALAEGGVGEGAKPLARIILANRPYDNAKELADLVRSSQFGKRGDRRGRAPKVHPATVVFQAIRMRINGERSEIRELLSQAPKLIKGAGSRLAVITFHSIEDTLVAREMRSWEAGGSYPASWRGARDQRSLGRVSPKKAIVPAEDEVARNPASRSARLRVFEFA
jgi:16S rRNA (cytosine1402-N4)-methyltransferase